MNEHSRLEPQSVIAQADEAIRNLNESNSRFRTARSSITAFIDDDTSSTQGINLLKQKMRDLRRIIDALTLANLVDIRDYQKLVSLVSAVDGNIIGHLVLGLLREVERSISHYEGRLQRAKLHLHLPVEDFPIQSGGLYQCAESMVRHYENILRVQNDLRNHLIGRIELFNMIESETRLLFRESGELRDEAMRGFTMVNQAAAGLPNSFTHSGLFEWRGNLRTKREEFNHLKDAKVEAAEEFITSLREEGVPFPPNWSEEDKIEFAKRYFDEMHILQAFMVEVFSNTNYNELPSFQNRERITFNFLSEPELAFHLTLNQRVKLLDIIDEHGMMYAPIRDFLNAELSEEELDNLRLSQRFPGDSFGLQIGHAYGAAVQGTTHHDWFTFLGAASWLDGAFRAGQFAGFAHDLQPGVTPAPAPGVPRAFAPPNRGPSWNQGQKPPTMTSGKATLNGRTIVNTDGKKLIRIPFNAKVRQLTPRGYGFEYRWVNTNGTTVKVRIHGIDPLAPSGSNASQGWTVRIMFGKKSMDSSGNLHPVGIFNESSPFYNPKLINDVHIPIVQPEKFPGVR